MITTHLGRHGFGWASLLDFSVTAIQLFIHVILNNVCVGVDGNFGALVLEHAQLSTIHYLKNSAQTLWLVSLTCFSSNQTKYYFRVLKFCNVK